MKRSIGDKLNIALAVVIFLGLFIFFVVKPDDAVSLSERRPLKTMPEASVETIFGKKGGSSFMDEFEVYAKDQFPMREGFRTLHALSGRYGLGRQEINDLYVTDGFIAKLEDGCHEADMVWAADRIGAILDKYGSDRATMAIIPDKNYYLAPEMGAPALDMTAFEGYFEERLGDRVSFVDLKGQLTKDHFYRTDSHWKQDMLPEIAARLLSEMGRPAGATAYRCERAADDFRGVYYGQAALPLAADTLNYLTWDGMENVSVWDHDSGKPVAMPLYNTDKLAGADPYEFFLSGSKGLITMENPAAPEGHLVLFRDSFGSSLAPLLLEGYRQVTVVDIRYISPSILDRFIDFENADVLFLYSTSVLNNSVGQILK
ncbi:MAG: hypothetical protein Q4B73_04165 [Lachnospiraceae bacterium]|nr:hypothetical protein [Lachnospiraceae bacterium]